MLLRGPKSSFRTFQQRLTQTAQGHLQTVGGALEQVCHGGERQPALVLEVQESFRWLRQAIDACRPQVIYHLATHGAYYHQRERSDIIATNLTGTANLLDALEGHDYEALVYTGSSSEYGHKSEPMRPEDRLEPRTDYGVTKAAATLLCLAEAMKGRPVSVVRVFSAFGPWEEPGRLVPYVVECCARGENPKVTAGLQPRDFVSVSDVVDLLKVAAVHPGARGQILHAGTGRQHTVRDMIETIVAVCGSGRVTPQFGTEPLRPGEPIHWLASIERTTALTGWKPRHDLRSGVESMWRWYLQRTGKQAA